MEAFAQDLGPLWARSEHWELDNPAAGDVLTSRGIRIFGSVETPGTPIAGMVPGDDAPGGADPRNAYIVSGSVVSASDYYVDCGQGRRHAGANVVLSIHGDLLQAQVPAVSANDIGSGSPLTVRGELSLVADCEWDAFGLVDTRRSWYVEEVHHLGAGDHLLLLRPAD